jgi:hypothetical protein
MITKFVVRAVICISVFLVIAVANGAESDYWPAESWRASAPEKQGLDLKTLNKIDEYIKTDFRGTTSALVVHNGYIVFEKYYQGGKDDQRAQYSISKTFMSALTGIAIGMKLAGAK